MKKRKHSKIKLKNILYTPDSYSDSVGFDFSLWKIISFVAGIILSIVYFLIMMDLTYRTIICIAAFCTLSVFPLCNIIINIRSGRILSESLIILFAGILCIVVSDLTSSVVLIFCYDIIKLVEIYLTELIRNEHDSLLDLLTDDVLVLNHNITEKRKSSRIIKGDYIGVSPGDIIPVDGIVIEGNSTIDYSKIVQDTTYENVSRESKVLSGGINTAEPLIIKAECDYADSFISRLFNICSESYNSETPETEFAIKISRLWVLAISILMIVIGIIIPAFKGTISIGIHKCIYLLLLMCPFSLYNTLSLASNCVLQKLVSCGVYLKNSSYISLLSKLRILITNKTGTLTENIFTIDDVCPIGISITNFLSLISKVESISSHPIASSIREYCGAYDVKAPADMLAEELSGRGIKAYIGRTIVLVGNAKLLSENNISFEPVKCNGNVVYVAVNNSYCGYFVFSNKMRKDSQNSMELIKSRGLHNLVLLTGDLPSNSRTLANSIGYTMLKTEVSIQEKAKITEYLMNNKAASSILAYVGNGVCEIDASSHADISVATDMIHYPDDIDKPDIIALKDGLSAFAQSVIASWRYNTVSKTVFALFSVAKLFIAILSVFSISYWILAVGIGIISIASLILTQIIIRS